MRECRVEVVSVQKDGVHFTTVRALSALDTADSRVCLCLCLCVWPARVVAACASRSLVQVGEHGLRALGVQYTSLGAEYLEKQATLVAKVVEIARS